MEFGFLGITYKDAGLMVRDKIAFTDGMKLQLFKKAEKAGVEIGRASYRERVCLSV